MGWMFRMGQIFEVVLSTLMYVQALNFLISFYAIIRQVMIDS